MCVWVNLTWRQFNDEQLLAKCWPHCRSPE